MPRQRRALSRFARGIASFSAALISVITFSNDAHATHFRGGSIRWTIPNAATPNVVKFTVQQAWRADYVECDELAFGDGTSSTTGCANKVEISSKTDDSGLNYKLIQYEVTHTYPLAVKGYTVSFASCCRISTLLNGANANFQVQAKLVVDAGKSSGPDAALNALNTLQIGATRSVSFSMVDPDRDPITCRLATVAEMGGTGNALPTVGGKIPIVTANASSCKITWDLSAAVINSRYALTVIVESTRGGLTSSLALDTIVITADGRAYGACDASPLATIERANMLAGRVPVAVSVTRSTSAYNLTCRNGRYGVVRLPLAASPTAREACAMVQTECTGVAKPSRLCFPQTVTTGATANQISVTDLTQIETAAATDISGLAALPKFKQLVDFVCEAK